MTTIVGRKRASGGRGRKRETPDLAGFLKGRKRYTGLADLELWLEIIEAWPPPADDRHRGGRVLS